MSWRHISLGRPITSYTRVQAVVSRLIRGRRFQLASPRVTAKDYLDLGCGLHTHPPFINVEYAWRPDIDLCWDIRRGIPVPDGRLRGVFTEHCLEHFSLPTVEFLLGECRRILRPGGALRVVVPDAGLYLRTYHARTAGDLAVNFPYEDGGRRFGLMAPLVSVNRIFYIDRESPAGHRCMFDEALLGELLIAAGFGEIRRAAFRQGSDPTLLIDTEMRAVESLYMEATA